jgi:ribonuclease D
VSHELRWDEALPEVVSTVADLVSAADALRAGEGPLGVDAERAGSYRYSQRAYLVQVYRRNAPVLLLDPVGIDDFSSLAQVLSSDEWVMQAAHNDLDCLADLGLVPPTLFDTEIAGQLLGLERVGLASLVESQLGYAMRKGHGQADWSRRPLRTSWLEYAVLDVCLLPDLEDELAEKLHDAGKMQWASQEFTHQLRSRPVVDPEARWLRTSGAGRLRTDAQRGALRALWFHRDALARSRDIAVHRIARDPVLVEMAKALPKTASQLAALPNMPRPVIAQAGPWLRVIERGAAEPVAWPERPEGPPQRSLRAWESRDPAAAKRWVALREALTQRADELQVWPQVLLAPDLVAHLAWEPPADPAQRLAELGARPWQIEHTIDLLEG